MKGNDKFTFRGDEDIAAVNEFWEFSYSYPFMHLNDISVFIVSAALGLKEPCGEEYWSFCNIVYDGLRINVRAVAYRPSWEIVSVLNKEQLRFDIAKANNGYKYTVDSTKRRSEIYVFCLHTNQGTPSPLELEAWRFFIFKTSVIDEVCGNSKYITLKEVNELCKAGLGHYCMFDDIKATIDNLYSHSEWKCFAENDFIYRTKLVQYLSKRKWNSYVPSVEEAILSQCPDFRLLKWVEPRLSS